MQPPLMPSKGGILSSLIPITEWWMFTNLYDKSLSECWADWSLRGENCSMETVLIHFHREPNEKKIAYLHVFGDWKRAIPMLKDAEKYFKVTNVGEAIDFCPFEEVNRKGERFKLEVE